VRRRPLPAPHGFLLGAGRIGFAPVDVAAVGARAIGVQPLPSAVASKSTE
jgi:hypothetical protein